VDVLVEVACHQFFVHHLFSNAVQAATSKCLLALKRIKTEGTLRKRKAKELRRAIRVEELENMHGSIGLYA
jgi:hypothetical protein